MCNSIILAILANAVSVTINQTYNIIQESLSPPCLAGRMIGITEAHIGNVPYQVSLQHNGFHECGGSIINKFWIVTAAYCVNGVPKKIITIRSGTSIANSGGTVRHVEKIFQHSRFDPLTLDYNIAVVKVSFPFGIGTKNENAIKLPKNKSYRPRKGVMGLTSSWGTISPSTNILPVHLQSAKLPFISHKKCNQAHLFLFVSDRMMCAGYLKFRQVSCRGDAGSPLVVNGMLVGIVSSGLGCGTPHYLGVYANVAQFIPWITNIIAV